MPSDTPRVRVYLGDEPFDMPAGPTLLHGLERLRGRSVAEGNYCWTGECGHCEVAYTLKGTARSAMACRLPVAPGLRIVALSRYLELDVRR